MLSLQIDIKGEPTRVASVNNLPVLLGRNPDSTIHFPDEKCPQVSWLHAEIVWLENAYHLVHRSNSNPTLLNGQPMVNKSVLALNDVIRLGTTGPELRVLEMTSSGAHSATTQLGIGPVHSLELGVAQIPLTDGLIVGRSPDDFRASLSHPMVSRQHARFDLVQKRYQVVDLQSANGTYVNGERISASVFLKPGDLIDIGPYQLVFADSGLYCKSRWNNIELSCERVTRFIPQSSGRGIPLLQDISLVIRPKRFVCLIGPSGSGKSTLLSSLSGRSVPSSGMVYINGRDLHRNFDALKENIVVVPQTTALYSQLTVEQCLRFTAALRLPSDSNKSDIDEALNRVLETVGLSHRRNVRIENLSGGQLKRVGLANELLADPSLLFLDEVTSGLDERSDLEMMELFRSLANSGKTIICVTHNLGGVERFCDLTAVLTVGGRLAYCGAPQQAKRYFEASSLAEIYDKLEEYQPEEWVARYVQSPEYQVFSKLNTSVESLPDVSRASSPHRLLYQSYHQTSVLLKRNARIWQNDWRTLVALFAQSALVALLICLVFGDVSTPLTTPGEEAERLLNIRNLLFLICVSIFWLGCNNSAKEIVKERTIYQRERDFNLQPEAYLISKFLTMIAIGFLQVVFMATAVFVWTKVPGSWVPHYVNLFELTTAGTCLGLAISSLSKTEETAIALVPAVVIPQIILAGVVAKLPTFASWISTLFVTVYWGHKSAMNLPVDHRMSSDFEPSMISCFAVIGLHAILFLATAWYAIRWRLAEK